MVGCQERGESSVPLVTGAAPGPHT